MDGISPTDRTPGLWTEEITYDRPTTAEECSSQEAYDNRNREREKAALMLMDWKAAYCRGLELSETTLLRKRGEKKHSVGNKRSRERQLRELNESVEFGDWVAARYNCGQRGIRLNQCGACCADLHATQFKILTVCSDCFDEVAEEYLKEDALSESSSEASDEAADVSSEA